MGKIAELKQNYNNGILLNNIWNLSNIWNKTMPSISKSIEPTSMLWVAYPILFNANSFKTVFSDDY